ncbi:MAG TPA: hypothetical protein VJB59_09100 [Bdellovibrionota bacterium]|nr:hypothetical protein [Bdellovibrionota bacterium]
MKIRIVSLIVLSTSAISTTAFADDKPLLLRSSLSGGVLYHSSTEAKGADAKEGAGGQVQLDLRKSGNNYDGPRVGTVLKASIGGVNTGDLAEDGTAEGIPVGEIDLILPWKSRSDTHGLSFATNHGLRSTPSRARYTPIAFGAQGLNEKQTARGEIFVVPFNVESNHRQNLNGISAGLKVLGEKTIANIIAVDAAVEGGIISGMKRSERTTTNRNCTTDSCGRLICGEDVILQTRSAAQQEGLGNYVSARTGLKAALGKKAFVKAEAIYDRSIYTVKDLKPTGTVKTDVNQSGVTGLISAGISW